MSQHEDNMEVVEADEPQTASKRKTEADHKNIGSTPGGVTVTAARSFARLTKTSAKRSPTISVVGSAQNAIGIESLAYVHAHKKGLLLGPKDKEEDGRLRMKVDPAHPENTKEHDNMLIDFLPLTEVFGEDVPAAQVIEAAARLNQTRRAATQSFANSVSRSGARHDGKGIAIGILGFPVSRSDVIIASPEGQKVLDMKVSEAQHHATRFEGVPDGDELTVGELLHAATFARTASQFKEIAPRLIETLGETRKRERGEDADDDAPAEKKAAVVDTKTGEKKAAPKKAAAPAPAAPKKAAPKKVAVASDDDEEVAPAPKKTVVPKKAAPVVADDEEVAPAPKKTAAAKKAAPVVADDDDDEEAAPAPKKAAAPKKTAAAPKKAAAAPKKAAPVEDEDEDEEAPAPKPAPKKVIASADW